MHPDRKIGIAMGILLVGVVGALFFRNEPLEQELSLSAQREQELNERLRERDVSLYPDEDTAVDDFADTQIQLNELLEQRQSGNKVVPTPMRREDPLPPVAKLPEQRNHKPLDFTPPHHLLKSEVDVNVAVENVQDKQPRVIDDSLVNANSFEPSKDDFTADSTEYDEYTVKFGDTLSGISQKFLGAHSRYREIYEANKDRLRSPDDLRVGKAIRIPRVMR